MQSSHMQSGRAMRVQPPTSLRTFAAVRPRGGALRCRCQAGVPQGPRIKVCGVTSPQDADWAARCGANLIGLIAWPRAPRSVSVDTARQIADAARSHGAEPVAVFVDESAEQIAAFCSGAGINIAQLHGDAARASYEALPGGLSAVYVLHADAAGTVQTPRPPAVLGADGAEHRPMYVLVDGLKGGSGEAFDWAKLQRPEGWGEAGWLLAGGLHPGNVADAITMLAPGGVDVSSGVCGPDKLAKDKDKVEAFVSSARAAFDALAAAPAAGK